MPEKTLIENCSPTLAGMKPANLISLPYESMELAKADIREMNRIFVGKGLRAVPLSYCKAHVLLYIYRPQFLKKEFEKDGVRAFLEQTGYDCSDADRCVIRLGERVRARKCSKDFPHEIGLFLGYPLEDVEGFIRHKDVGCKCIGAWRVYGDVSRAMEVFQNYRRCTDAYLRSWELGRTLEQLTVVKAAS